MRIDIMTLFPETVNAVLHESIIGRAAKKGIIQINCVQIRDFTENRQNQVDDYPYGGGWGCIMNAQPLKKCLDNIMSTAAGLRSRVIYLSPQGRPYNQEEAKRLKKDYEHLVLVCGHYEGVDERFIENCVDEEISLGDFVLTGGEIAAMAIADSVCRLVPGVLSNEECYKGESHWDGLLEYPQYTRPEIWENIPVPEVLLNGDHAKISRWRRKQQLLRTMEKRPDLFEKFNPEDKTDIKLIDQIRNEENKTKITDVLGFRRAEICDISYIMKIISETRDLLKRHGVNQWQGTYPDKNLIIDDISNGESYVIKHGNEIAAFFTLSKAYNKNYDEITDGKWTEMDYCVLNHAAVSLKYRGTKIAEFMMKSIDEVAAELGLRCIRTDTHKENKTVQKLLRESGYRYRGNVFVDEGRDDQARVAYEKIMKKKN